MPELSVLLINRTESLEAVLCPAAYERWLELVVS